MFRQRFYENSGSKNDFLRMTKRCFREFFGNMRTGFKWKTSFIRRVSSESWSLKTVSHDYPVYPYWTGACNMKWEGELAVEEKKWGKEEKVEESLPWLPEKGVCHRWRGLLQQKSLPWAHGCRNREERRGKKKREKGNGEGKRKRENEKENKKKKRQRCYWIKIVVYGRKRILFYFLNILVIFFFFFFFPVQQ